MKKVNNKFGKPNFKPVSFGIWILAHWHISIIAFTMLLLSQSCKSGKEQMNQTIVKKMPGVKVQMVSKTKLVSFVDITGTVQANIFSEIKSPADGIIEKLFARENQLAEKDKLIAIINPNDRVALIANNQLLIQQLEQKLNVTEKSNDAYNRLLEDIEKAKLNLE